MDKRILKDIQFQELVKGLETRSLPLKLQYLGKGAGRWDRLSSSLEYGLGRSEGDLLTDNAHAISGVALKDNSILVFDLGCGNGRKLVPLLNSLSSQGKVDLFLVDLSRELLKLASSHIKKESTVACCNTVICDLENSDQYAGLHEIRDQFSDTPCLYLLLGNTLGNFAQPEIVLSDLRRTMKPSDLLLVGTEINNGRNEERLIEHYRNDAIYSVQFSVLEALGVDRRDGAFAVEYNRACSQVETYFIFNRSVSISLYDEAVSYANGERMLLMVSRKYSISELQTMLRTECLAIVDTLLDKEGRYCLMLSRAT